MRSGPLYHGTPDTVPWIRLEFPFAPSLDGVGVTDIEWTQQRNRHDLMQVRVSGVSPDVVAQHVPGGSPVKATIATSAGRKTLHGYVHKSEPEFDYASKSARLSIVSAGYPLKQAAKSATGDVTASMVAGRIAARHKLFADIEPHPRKFRQLVQSGETDWEFLTRVADEVGFSVRVDGATLRFASRAALAKHYRSLAPTLRYVKRRGSSLYEVLEFRPLDGAYLDETVGVRARRRVDYLDEYAKRFASSSSDKPRDTGRKGKDPDYTRFTSATAKTFREASLIADAATQANRYPVTATATVVGNPLIAPDVMLFLKGVGAKYEGYWTVLEASHIILPTRYSIDLRLGLEEAAGTTGPGSRHQSRYRLRTPYPVPRLTRSGVRSGRQSVRIPDFFQDGPRWVGRGG